MQILTFDLDELVLMECFNYGGKGVWDIRVRSTIQVTQKAFQIELQLSQLLLMLL
jgi:hypothetical protein